MGRGKTAGAIRGCLQEVCHGDGLARVVAIDGLWGVEDGAGLLSCSWRSGSTRSRS